MNNRILVLFLFLSSSVSAAPQCPHGLVWREANKRDKVCVTSRERDLVQSENREAHKWRQINSDRCLFGHVWREANPEDRVCVTVDRRTQVAQNNAMAPERERRRKLGIVVGSHPHFLHEIELMKQGLKRRGYDVISAPDRAMRVLEDVARTVQAGDQVFISLQCHGSINREGPDLGPKDWDQHGCCVNATCTDWIHTNQMTALASQLTQQGARVTVSDHSCNGGNTVLALQKIPEVCAISTTTTASPALTNFPSFGSELRDNTKLRSFEDLGESMNLVILKEIQNRPHQRIYQSGCSDEWMRLRTHLWYVSMSLGSWDLKGSTIYNAIYPKHPKGKAPLSVYLERSRRFTELLDQVLVEETQLFAERISDTAFNDKFEQTWPVIKSQYKNSDITYNFQHINSLTELIDQIQGAIHEVRQVRDALEVKLIQFEIAIQKRRSQKRITDLRSEIQALHKQTTKKNRPLGPLLNVLETVDCKLKETPCRDMAI